MGLTHLDKDGNPGMVDISQKLHTIRVAVASGNIIVGKDIMKELLANDLQTPKGSITQTAIISGTMAVKNTYNNIPLCHQIPITSCKFHIDSKEDRFNIQCTVKTNSQTGVEMEALQGVTTAALTIYDMCKALCQRMEITNIQLDKKTGGKQDYERQTP